MLRTPWKSTVGIVLLASFCDVSLNAQPTQDGSEFQVNSYTTGNQEYPDIARHTDGSFVIVWQSGGSGSTDTSGNSIQGQRYSSSGAPAGAQFQVNTYTTSNVDSPAIGMDSDGDFVVAWGSDYYTTRARAQRFDSSGAAQGAEIQVGVVGTESVNRIAVEDDGDFTIIWGRSGEIEARRYDSAGTAQGPSFAINTYTTSTQTRPAIKSMGNDGSFLAVWQSDGGSGDTSSTSVQGRLAGAGGTPQGSDFQINELTSDSQYWPDVDRLSTGEFVVVWQSRASGDLDIKGRLLSSTGTPMGSEFQINSYTTGTQRRASVAVGNGDNFIVIWDQAGPGDSAGVFFRGFDATGAPLFTDQLTNTTTSASQRTPRLGMLSSGDFVATWRSDESAGDDSDQGSIQGQLYDGPVPVTLQTFDID